MLTDVIRSFLRDNAIEGPLLLAVSGGVDSTALLLASAELPDVEAAHVNHHLRGAESDADEAFVRDLCARLGIRLHVVNGMLDDEAIKRSGIETAAREVRYRELQKLRRGWIVTAHQKNDQAETVLMRLMSGGGLAALRGIHAVRDDRIIRPLLTVTRAQIERFLEVRGVQPRFDRSNADLRFLRNRIRATLDPADIDQLAAIADQAREQWAVFERMVDEIPVDATDSDARFSVDDIWLRRALLHRHIHRLDPSARDVSAADLERLANGDEKRVSVTGKVELLRHDDEWVLRKRIEPMGPFEVSLALGERVDTPVGLVTVRFPGGGTAAALQKFQLPAGATPKFTVRNRRDGDRFQPLGMANHKKLKDFLIDRKIPAEVRDRIPLLIWNGAIIWVAGVEVSETFKVTGEAGDVYEVALDEENQESLQRESDRRARRAAR